MNDPAASPVPRRSWLGWRPGESIMANSASTEPTKPSEPGFGGFDGSSSAKFTEIGAPPDGQTGPLFPAPEYPCGKSITAAVDSATATERVMSWAEWKAGALNQVFLDLGNTDQPGRITADTIRHGERARMTNWNRDVASQKFLRSE